MHRDEKKKKKPIKMFSVCCSIEMWNLLVHQRMHSKSISEIATTHLAITSLQWNVQRKQLFAQVFYALKLQKAVIHFMENPGTTSTTPNWNLVCRKQNVRFRFNLSSVIRIVQIQCCIGLHGNSQQRIKTKTKQKTTKNNAHE